MDRTTSVMASILHIIVGGIIAGLGVAMLFSPAFLFGLVPIAIGSPWVYLGVRMLYVEFTQYDR